MIAVTISFGVTPPAISLLELVHMPKTAVVALSRRRRVEYTDLFKTDRTET
jgi:hypothetical protein